MACSELHYTALLFSHPLALSSACVVLLRCAALCGVLLYQLLDVLYPLLVELIVLSLMDDTEPLNPALSATITQ